MILRLALAVLLMLSAISLVTARYQARELYVAAEQLSNKARELDTEWRRLQLERAELARNARIDGIARQDLNMITGTPDRTIYLRGNALNSTVSVPANGGVQ